ncbi:ABC transporter substrate-binding protein [Yinghuangia sp. YIM S09857]|uniref:ABC transporter substrate-binding protein n=1 Tax=Yinghuangia sp. YIM S09857 TaxID=3436929 RepID=UPI003F53A8EB
MSIALVADSRGLDPFTASLSSATDYTRMNALYDQLLWADPGEGVVQPKLAETFTSTDGGATWVLRIKPNVTFSDGTPFDAAAVKFTWDRHADPATRSPYASSLRGVTTQVQEPLALKVTLAESNSRFDQIVATQLGYIVSPTAYRADPQGFAHKPVGAGPFTLKEWVPGDHQTYIRNPGYWQHGKPKLDQLTVRVMPDQEQAFAAVDNGTLDLVVTVDDMGGATAADAGFDVRSLVTNGSSGVHFNAARPPFDDSRARKALSLAVSREDFNKAVYGGDANPADGLFSEKSPFIDHGAVPKMDSDVDKARALARELASEGTPISFTLLLPRSPLSEKIGDYLTAKWTKLPGVKVRVEMVELATLGQRVQLGRDFQAVYYGMPSPAGEPVFWNSLFSGSPTNYLAYSSPAADAALRGSRNALTPEDLKSAYTKLAQAYAEDVPVMPLVDQVTYAYAKPGRLAGFRFTDAGSIWLEYLGMAD